jgi:hypothetical protein
LLDLAEARGVAAKVFEIIETKSKIDIYKTSDKKVAHLAVTHGFFVNRFARTLNGFNPYAEVCSISGATLSNGEASLVLDQYADHVQTW